MRLNDLQHQIEPGKHLGENRVSVHLAGVKDHISKNRHNLFEAIRKLQKIRIQLVHLRPEGDSRHCKIALQTALMLSFQTSKLLRG